MIANVARKETVVVLGTGWASFSFTRNIDRNRFNVRIVSPRNHFLFTPMLASSTVGTVEFRSIVQPIRDTTGRQGMSYHFAQADLIDCKNKLVKCSSAHPDVGGQFDLSYDKLVVGIGVVPGTFGVPGVRENSIFLKELANALEIRRRIISAFETARDPSVPDEIRKRVLHFVVVGGGPTGVEFCAELGDFLRSDVPKYFPHLNREWIKVTLLEAGTKILTAFDKALVARAQRNFEALGIEIRTDAKVQEVTSNELVLATGERIPFGLCVWSAGVEPRDVVSRLDLPKDKQQRLLTNDHLQSLGHDDIYVIGDCGRIDGFPLPATAQVAQQQGIWLAKNFAKLADKEPIPRWEYHHLGFMAYIGRYKSLLETKHIKESGLFAWLAWRSAYLTRLGSMKNRLQVPLDWLKTFFWGRDITYF